jgi:WD40 repeat protein
VWDRATGHPLLTLKGHADRVDQVIFSPNGSRLATLSHDRTARLWDATTGQMLFLLPAYDEQNVSYGNNVDVAFSPDGSRLATAGGSSIKIWDTSNGQQVLALPQTKELFAYTIAFSPDGKQLAVGFRWGTANVWDVATGRKLFDLPGHSASVLKIAFSPDGSRIATTGVDGTARLWDAATGAEQLALTGHTGQIGSLAFSPDGTQLATGGTDGAVRVYALRVEDLIKIAQSRVTRSLTTVECQKYLHTDECPTTP